MDARRENKAYFLVIPVDKTVHSEKDAAMLIVRVK